MNDDIVSALLEWNPWLKNGVPQELVGFPREYNITSYLEIPEIKILEGVRRAGKSTLLYQVVQHALLHNKKVLYINFEDEILRQHSLSEIFYAFLKHDAIEYLLVDEIQHCPDWVPFIRKMYDKKELSQIWITGSNSSLMRQEYAGLLTGRNLKLSISPLSFSEYLGFKDINQISLPLTKRQEVEIKKHFQNYLNTGAFPAITLRKVYQRELLINYFEDFLYKDIASRHDVNTAKLKDLAIFLATNSAKLFSYRNVANILGLHPNTINDYIKYLQDVFLFDQIYRFDYSLKKQHSHDKKIYIIDTGLANAISFRFSEDKGRLLETVVFQALKKQGAEIYFHRGNKECDFVIKEGVNIKQAIQVSCSLDDPKTKEREINGLLDACQTFDLTNGTILTLDETDKKIINIDKKVYIIDIQPVWKWLLSS